MAPDTIMDAGAIIVRVEPFGNQLRLLESDDVKLKDGKITIYRSKKEIWEVKMAGQYQPSGKAEGTTKVAKPKKKATKKKVTKKKAKKKTKKK